MTETGCWLWLKALSVTGYAVLQYGGKVNKVSRLSYGLYKGEVPDCLHVLHRCDNPVCINPDHLFLGTDKDNMRDKQAKGRGFISSGAKSGMAKLTEAQVEEALTSTTRHIDLASKFKVSADVIVDVRSGLSWKDSRKRLGDKVIWHKNPQGKGLVVTGKSNDT